MIIHVTQEDIDNGLKFQGGMCPIALAVKRAISSEWQKPYVSVGTTSIMISDKGQFYLPRTAMRFISNFDAYGPSKVSPFTFETVGYES